MSIETLENLLKMCLKRQGDRAWGCCGLRWQVSLEEKRAPTYYCWPLHVWSFFGVSENVLSPLHAKFQIFENLRWPWTHFRYFSFFPHSYNKLFDFFFKGVHLFFFFSCLIEYFYKIKRWASPFYEWGLDSAPQRYVLHISAASTLGETWSSSSDATKIKFLLFGVKSVIYDKTVLYFLKCRVL